MASQPPTAAVTDTLQKYFCPRLIDYLAIVGSVLPPAKNEGDQSSVDSSLYQNPKILRRYPQNDHPDFPLSSDMIYFCQPENPTISALRRAGRKDANIFVFTLTDKDTGKTRYGICLNFVRTLDREAVKMAQASSVRRDSWRYSGDKSTDSAFSSDHRSVFAPSDSEKEKEGLNDNRRDQSLDSLRPNSLFVSTGQDSESGGSTCPSPRLLRKKISRPRMLTSLCLISHHPFFSLFRECVITLRKLVETCNDEISQIRRNGCNKTRKKCYLRDTIWSLMTGFFVREEIQKSPLVQHLLRDIETWILKLLSAPVPVPGYTRVEVSILPHDLHRPLIFALPDHTRFPLADYPLHLPLELLGVDACLWVLTLIMLEHKIVFISRDYNALALSIMAFVQMLYPLEYMFPVIPLLPATMPGAEQLFFAPTPFIIGIPGSFFQEKKYVRLPEDVWLVDLDSGKLVPSMKYEEVPKFSEPECGILRNHLKQALSSMSSSLPKKDREQPAKQEDMEMSSNSFNPFIFGNDVDSVDIATRVAMVRFLNSQNLLANFTEHTRTLRLYPRPVVAFQIDSFLRSRGKLGPFLQKLCRTQAIEYFSEWSLVPTNLAFLRVQTGVFDPLIIGDKPKWYAHNLEPILLNIWDDNCVTHKTLKQFICVDSQLTDESGSDTDDSDNSGSHGTDILSDVPSSDLSAGDEDIDLNSFYNPPRRLQLPGGLEMDPESNQSGDESISSSSSQSSIGNDVESKPEEALPLENTVAPPSPRSKILEKAGSFFGRSDSTASIKESNNESRTRHESISSTHRVSQSSLFEQLANQAKELVKDSGQDKILAQIRSHAKERLQEVRQQSEEGIAIFAPLEQFTMQGRKAAGDAGRIVQEASKSTIEDLSSVAKSSPLADFTKTATAASKKGFFKALSSAKDAAVASRTQAVKSLGSFGSIGSLSIGSLGSVGSASSLTSSSNSNNTVVLLEQRKNLRIETDTVPSCNDQLPKSAPPVPTNPFLPDFPPTNPFLVDQTTNLRKIEENYVKIPSPLNISRIQSSENVDEKVKVELPKSPRPEAIALAGKEFFSNVGTELNELATQTTSVFGDLLGVKNVKRADSRDLPSPTNTQRESIIRPGPFPARRSLVERSPLIRHTPIHKPVTNREEEPITDQKQMISLENQTFIKEVINQVLDGEGVGWLRYTRVKKLLEDENLRALVASRINRGLEQKVGPDDLVGDICVSRSVWKGMLKLIQGCAAGLEVSYNNHTPGGIASTFQLLEVAHTHYWSKDPADLKSDLTPRTVSQGSSPYSSRDNLKAIASPSDSKPTTPDSFLPSSQDTYVLHPPSDDNGRIVTNPNLLRSQPIAARVTASDSEIDRMGLKPGEWSPRSSLGVSLQPSRRTSSLLSSAGTPSPDQIRKYVYEGLLGKERLTIWDQSSFWEDAFFDAVAQERDIIGLDQGPAEMMERYKSLSDTERRRLEHEEDRLLSNLLYNLTAFMVMMEVNRNDIRKRVRRLLGKSHIGLAYSQQIHVLLDKIDDMSGNDVDIRPLGSRQLYRQSFTVHVGTGPEGELRFLEVRDDGLVLRALSGAIVERWWFERIVNMTYSPKTKVLCMWRRNGEQTQLHKYYTRKCKLLYQSIQEAMERAAARGAGSRPGAELGGEFPVQDLRTGEGGLLQVCLEGVGLLFVDSKFFVRLENIRKCFTQKGGIFVLEEFNPKTRQVTQRRYQSSMSHSIALSVHRVFSVCLTQCSEEVIQTALELG
ncbi:MAP kinase-activating death domain protein-like isoform X2 [Artemia franciscana]|uniref:MAP kinase-activating death domain protein-like isoform X2 n=1 Tax=Artemia franciscana TaxID=6661 RepID=UPI0032DB6302